MPLPMPPLPSAAISRGLVILSDEIVEIVVRLENHVAAATAVAAARTALGHVRFAMKRDRALAAVPGARVNLDLVDEHASITCQ